MSLPDKVALNLSACVFPLREKEREISALFVYQSFCMCVFCEREKKRYISALFAVKLSLSSLLFVVKTVKDREVL